jgi:hypothetical protein
MLLGFSGFLSAHILTPQWASCDQLPWPRPGRDEFAPVLHGPDRATSRAHPAALDQHPLPRSALLAPDNPSRAAPRGHGLPSSSCRAAGADSSTPVSSRAGGRLSWPSARSPPLIACREDGYSGRFGCVGARVPPSVTQFYRYCLVDVIRIARPRLRPAARAMSALRGRTPIRGCARYPAGQRRLRGTSRCPHRRIRSR